MEADHAQAVYFRVELRRQIAALNEQIANYTRALQRLRTRSEVAQIRRTERALRESHNDQIALTRMLDSLNDRFPEA